MHVKVRDRLQWIGWRSLLLAWCRELRLVLRDRVTHAAITEQLDTPADMANRMGLATFAGREPHESGPPLQGNTVLSYQYGHDKISLYVFGERMAHDAEPG